MNSIPGTIASLVAVALYGGGGAASPALAEGCNLPALGEGRIEAIVDSRGIRLQDGREVRLAGIEPVPARRDSGIALLSRLASGREAALRGDSDAPDRYGRQRAFVFIDGDAVSLQSRIVGQGEAVVAIDVADPGCRTELLAAERDARINKRGVWVDPSAIKNADNPGDILTRMGQFVLVEGKVVSVRQAGASIYLNFGRRWTRDFAVTISRPVTASFEAAGVALKSLENKRIRVRGWVEQRGGPRIEIRQAGQIELPGDN